MCKLTVKRLGWHRWVNFGFTATSCGRHLSCCVRQLDLSTELRKPTSTASLSSCRRSCSERHRTSSTSNLRRVRSRGTLIFYRIISVVCMRRRHQHPHHQHQYQFLHACYRWQRRRLCDVTFRLFICRIQKLLVGSWPNFQARQTLGPFEKD